MVVVTVVGVPGIKNPSGEDGGIGGKPPSGVGGGSNVPGGKMSLLWDNNPSEI